MFDIRDGKADEDGSAIKWFLIKKLTATIFEFADRWLAHRATAAARKIETPLVRLRIVAPQVQSLYVAGRAINLEFYQIARPFQTFRMTLVPSYSTQVLEPLRGC